MELLPALSRHAELRVVRPPDWSPPADWPLSQLPYIDRDTAALGDEITLVHLGNNSYHEWLLPLLDGPRVVVVLHDLVLHHLLVESTLAHGAWEPYCRALCAAEPGAGAALARARRFGITGPRDPFLFPAWQAFTRAATAVVVHSQWARERVQSVVGSLPVLQMGLTVTDPGPVNRLELRARLGLDDADVVLMHLGFLNQEKGVADILTGLIAARELGINARLVLVGEGDLLRRLTTIQARERLHEALVAPGWVSYEQLLTLPAAADLGVVIRRPSAGETSAAALRFLACGTPVAVTALPQFLEIPEPAAPRLGPLSAAADLAHLLTHITSHPEAWAQRRQQARQAWENGHRPEQAAASLARFLSSLR